MKVVLSDDIFLACALAARTRIVVSGDRHLLRVSGFRGVQVLRPRAFVQAFL
jgi:predicted nucleic acid-binding protein